MQERANTGRIYLQNVDHCNTHSAFDASIAPIKQSNLCMEITLPTRALKLVQDEQGEVALCTLSAVNLGAIDNLEELKSISEIIVRALDSLLDYQDYPLKAADIASKNRRTLGIGVTNFAYYLAKNNLKYSDGSANSLTHKTFEALQFYALKASNKLAKEKGSCPLFGETQYAKGILPIDNYKQDVDNFCNEPLVLDWEGLRADIKKTGLRNSTLTALMPCESSSQISNSTNGIEPPRGFVSIKQSKDGILKQIVPEYQKLKDKYELLWDIKENEGYLQLCAIMQKFIDQSISTNTHYDPSQFESNRVPMKLFLMDLLKAYKYGIKTLYYHTTRDGSNEELEKQDDNACADGVCKL
jgi:ribonucleoside-diphosphate reductase alpha chain